MASKPPDAYRVGTFFLKLPLDVMQLRRCNGVAITLAAKVTFAKLASNLNRSIEMANASQRLAEDFGLSRNAIRRALKCLAAAHLIQRIARRRPNGLHHVNGYLLIAPELVVDDARLHRLTAEALQRREQWDAECVVALAAASDSDDDFYAADDWPSAADAPDGDGPEWTNEPMVQNGPTGWSETDLSDGSNRTTQNGPTPRAIEMRRIEKEIRRGDDMENREEPDEAQSAKIIARAAKIAALECGHKLPWRDANGETTCMACDPAPNVHLIPNAPHAIRAFVESVTTDLGSANDAAAHLRALDDARRSVIALGCDEEADDE